MNMANRLRAQRRDRRAFLKQAGIASAAALSIGFEWTASTRRTLAATGGNAPEAGFAPNAFLRIDTDGSVTVIAKHVEMGQGAYTGIATIVAEELDADWARIRVESAPADAKRYANLVFGTIQGTGGSSAMANSWIQLREAGAKARAVLVAAAAKQWHVPASELLVDKGVVTQPGTHRHAGFGDLVPVARSLPVPDKVTLKDPRDFKLIGQRVPRVDVPAKCDGTAQFTLDTVFPGMLVALLRRAPRFGATVQSFDGTAAAAVPGVIKVVQVPRGVGIIADSFWAAKRGRDALVVNWDETHAEKRSSAQLMEEYRRLADQPARSARKQGDAAQALGNAARKVSATYEFPYLAHAPMEPLDAVVKLTADGCEIWAGDQFQTIDQANAARTCGLEPGQVTIHTLYAGGSFGRRASGAACIVPCTSISSRRD
jgi:isoquinoline 1-oxidoreductase beta subunit